MVTVISQVFTSVFFEMERNCSCKIQHGFTWESTSSLFYFKILKSLKISGYFE